VELNTNHIPKGLVPLKRLFENNVVSKKSSIQSQEKDVFYYNIGTAVDPKIIKLSNALSEEQKRRYVNMMKEFVDVFAWSYEDPKIFDIEIIQHNIPLKMGSKHFRQKMRQFNPMLLLIIEKELKILLDAKIIVPLRYSEWVENLVPVRKKNGEIRLCVDFRNLKRCSLKDDYPLPKIDHILHKLVGSQRISMLDGYFGYNRL